MKRGQAKMILHIGAHTNVHKPFYERFILGARCDRDCVATLLKFCVRESAILFQVLADVHARRSDGIVEGRPSGSALGVHVHATLFQEQFDDFHITFPVACVVESIALNVGADIVDGIGLCVQNVGNEVGVAFATRHMQRRLDFGRSSCGHVGFFTVMLILDVGTYKN